VLGQIAHTGRVIGEQIGQAEDVQVGGQEGGQQAEDEHCHGAGDIALEAVNESNHSQPATSRGDR